jgi:hypothetical protein
VQGAVGHREGDEPVVDGGQVAEAVAEEQGAARAERRVVENSSESTVPRDTPKSSRLAKR